MQVLFIRPWVFPEWHVGSLRTSAPTFSPVRRGRAAVARSEARRGVALGGRQCGPLCAERDLLSHCAPVFIVRAPALS